MRTHYAPEGLLTSPDDMKIIAAVDAFRTIVAAVRFTAQIASASGGKVERADRRAATGILRDAATQARMGKRANLRYYKPARRLYSASAIPPGHQPGFAVHWRAPPFQSGPNVLNTEVVL